MITGLTHITLQVADLERSAAFYSGAFGFARAMEVREQDGRVQIVYLRIADGQFIRLIQAREMNGERVENVWFGLEVDDLNASVEELRAKGIPTVGRPEIGLDGFRRALIVDPDGHRIELVQPAWESIRANVLHE